MRLLDLTLQNIGPFDDAHLEFWNPASKPVEPAPVAVITGENGTGKTILLDAIRGLFGPNYGHLERAIWRPDTPFLAEMNLAVHKRDERLASTQFKKLKGGPFELQTAHHRLRELPKAVAAGRESLGRTRHCLLLFYVLLHHAS